MANSFLSQQPLLCSHYNKARRTEGNYMQNQKTSPPKRKEKDAAWRLRKGHSPPQSPPLSPSCPRNPLQNHHSLPNLLSFSTPGGVKKEVRHHSSHWEWIEIDCCSTLRSSHFRLNGSMSIRSPPSLSVISGAPCKCKNRSPASLPEEEVMEKGATYCLLIS